jgi:hypothetical protein
MEITSICSERNPGVGALLLPQPLVKVDPNPTRYGCDNNNNNLQAQIDSQEERLIR